MKRDKSDHDLSTEEDRQIFQKNHQTARTSPPKKEWRGRNGRYQNNTVANKEGHIRVEKRYRE